MNDSVKQHDPISLGHFTVSWAQGTTNCSFMAVVKRVSDNGTRMWREWHIFHVSVPLWDKSTSKRMYTTTWMCAIVEYNRSSLVRKVLWGCLVWPIYWIQGTYGLLLADFLKIIIFYICCRGYYSQHASFIVTSARQAALFYSGLECRTKHFSTFYTDPLIMHS